MARVLLFALLILFLVRALARLWKGVVEGIEGPRGQSPVPGRGVQMVRDPVCGTFVVPDRALTLSVGRDQHYFCSPKCRDAFRARTA